MPDDVSPDVDSRDADDMADVVLAKQRQQPQQQVPLPRPRPIPYRRFPPQPEMPMPMDAPPQPQRNLYQVWRDMLARGTHRPPDTAEGGTIPFQPWPPAPDTFDQRFDPERANQADANFDEMKNRLQFADDMRNAGLGTFVPETGYAEGAPAPLYRPPGGADVVNPGSIQRLIEESTSGTKHEDPNHVYHMFRRRQQDI